MWKKVKKDGKTHAGAAGTLRTSGSWRTRWTLSGTATVNYQWRATASICIHHNRSQHPMSRLRGGTNRNQEKHIWIDVGPLFAFSCFSRVVLSQTQERRWKKIFKTISTISHHVLWYVGNMLKSPAKRKTHSSSHLTMAPTSPFSPFSPGGPGKPCQETNKHFEIQRREGQEQQNQTVGHE